MTYINWLTCLCHILKVSPKIPLDRLTLRMHLGTKKFLGYQELSQVETIFLVVFFELVQLPVSFRWNVLSIFSLKCPSFSPLKCPFTPFQNPLKCPSPGFICMCTCSHVLFISFCINVQHWRDIYSANSCGNDWWIYQCFCF